MTIEGDKGMLKDAAKEKHLISLKIKQQGGYSNREQENEEKKSRKEV